MLHFWQHLTKYILNHIHIILQQHTCSLTGKFHRHRHYCTDIVRRNNRPRGVFSSSLVLTLAVIRVPTHSTFSAANILLVLWEKNQYLLPQTINEEVPYIRWWLYGRPQCDICTSHGIYHGFAYSCGLISVDLTHIGQDYFIGTDDILLLPQCQSNDLDEMWYMYVYRSYWHELVLIRVWIRNHSIWSDYSLMLGLEVGLTK